MLQVVRIEERNAAGETLVDRRGRNYKILRVMPEPEYKNGRRVLPTTRQGTKVIFDSDPSGRTNPLFDMIQEGDIIPGEIKTVATKPYFIPSSYGNDENEGEIGNWVNKYTAVVMEGENIYQLASSNGLEPVDSEGNSLDNKGEPLPSAKEIASNERSQSASDDNPF